MAIIQPQAPLAGWAAASGNNNGGVARGISLDHVQDAGSRVFSSCMPLNSDPDGIPTNIGSKVITNDGTGAVTTDRHGVGKAVSGGTLAFTPATTGTRSEEWVIMGVSTKIGGVANAQLTSSRTHNDGVIKDSIHGTILAGSGTFSNPNNSFDSLAAPSTNITPNMTHSSVSYNTDTGLKHTLVNPADGTVAVASEIFPSRSVPGELTYHFGGVGKPTTDEYKAKDAFEA